MKPFNVGMIIFFLSWINLTLITNLMMLRGHSLPEWVIGVNVVISLINGMLAEREEEKSELS